MSKKSKARELAIEELKELGDDEGIEKLIKIIEKKNVVAVGTHIPGRGEKIFYLESWGTRMKRRFLKMIGRA